MPARHQNFDFRYTCVCPHLPPIIIPISYKKHLILLKLGAFYDYLFKIHPIYVNWAPSSAVKTLDHYTKIGKQAPQKAGTLYIIPYQCETPPG